MLPNDPRVAELTPIQVDWMIFNLSEEAKKIKGALGGGEGGITDAASSAQLDALIDNSDRGDDGR